MRYQALPAFSLEYFFLFFWSAHPSTTLVFKLRN